MIWLMLLAVLSALFYYKVIKPLHYWRDRGVVHARPLPILGNYALVAFKQISIFDQVREWYKQFSKERYFGIHQFFTPVLMVRDLELIKRITVKDYEYFIDHNNLMTEEIEPLMGKSLLNLKGQRWRDMRAALSPSFTSSKMKMMFSLMSDCAEELTQHFRKLNQKLAEVEIKDIFTRFTNDVIATTAFGLKCNSLEEKNNKFYMMGKITPKFSVFNLLLMNVGATFPKISKFLQLRVIPQSAADFFTDVINETLTKREKEGLIRPDMISLLMEARKDQIKATHCNQKLILTNEDITAQALIFFFGGFETTATLMTFIAYELALNPGVQKRLQEEIDETLLDCKGKLTYEALHKMKYMDMVVSETIRKWPPGFFIDRLCVKDYIVEPSSSTEKQLVIERGTIIQIPIAGIHRDPKFHPNPDEFDPERFNDQNKVTMEPFSYLPFGSGPRVCIASRFALMENKILMFYLLSKFDILRIDKTIYPMETSKLSFHIVPVNGVWLGISPRKVEVFNPNT
ncbi:hypothetical protein FQR65_LT17685 [Abscondita terminalis]|nr:hypothetical protein FQR65_LT17685 [Abscondita terminalis]